MDVLKIKGEMPTKYAAILLWILIPGLQFITYFLSLSDSYVLVEWGIPRPSIGYPVWEFLTQPPGQFDDLFSYFTNPKEFATFPTTGNFTLFPGSIVFYSILTLFGPVFSIAVFSAFSFAILITAINKFDIPLNRYLPLLFSYPVVFTLSRGNNDLLLFAIGLLLVSEIISLKRVGRLTLYSSVLLLLEPIPFLFFLAKEKVRIGLYSLGSLFLTAFLVSFLLPPRNLIGYFKSLIGFASGHSTNPYPGSSLFSTSIQSGLRIATYLITEEWPSFHSHASLTNVSIFYTGYALILYFGFRAKMPFDQKYILLCMIWLATYSTSFDYRLIWALIPVILFLRMQTLDTRRIVQLILLNILITPKTFIWWPAEGGAHIGSLINPIIEITLIFSVFFRSS